FGPGHDAEFQPACALAHRVTADLRTFIAAVDPRVGERLNEQGKIVMPASVLVAADVGWNTVAGEVPNLAQQAFERMEMHDRLAPVRSKPLIEPGWSHDHRSNGNYAPPSALGRQRATAQE